MIRVAVLGVVATATAYVLRRRLVDLLTATTGTWIGSPRSPTTHGSAVGR